jgi:predicted CXXCH cytochrome family protein
VSRPRPAAPGRRRLLGPLAAALALGLLAAPGGAAARNGAWRESAHGDRQRGVARVPGLPRGECGHCHGAPRDAGGRKADGNGHTGLFSPDENGLCLECHRRAAGGWLGEPAYEQSAHGGSPAAVWPGPDPRGRPAADAGKCVNCHDPHGARDAAGLVPRLLRVRGAALCLGCHAGNPATDVAAAFAKTYRHPLVAEPAPAGALPRTGAAAGPLRAEAGTCSGCHDPHAAAPDLGRGGQGGPARALLGVPRVRLANGPAGAPPVRTPVEPSDLAAVREHEVCFRCHAAAAGLGGADVAAAFNPANASYHPVEAEGRSGSIDRRAFAPGWGAGRLVTCSDCHGSDDDAARGPHGSGQPHLLRRRHLERAPAQQLLETDLCFECHAWRTYADPAAGAERAFSRFGGHAGHAARGISCWACHEPHGSALRPALLALRSPGLVAYAQDAAGGSCTVSCHASTPATAAYCVAYPR